jgi:hypothetical protein
MEIRNTEPSRIFHATGGGAGLDFDHFCSHGSPAISFHLLSEHGGGSDDIGILLPSCAAPALFGAALACIKAHSGSAAADEFVREMFSACDEAVTQIETRVAEHKEALHACCEAGYRTQGREHTCPRSTDAPA